jgi:hypothetical protein
LSRAQAHDAQRAPGVAGNAGTPVLTRSGSSKSVVLVVCHARLYQFSTQ